jgi:hypothetical protein
VDLTLEIPFVGYFLALSVFVCNSKVLTSDENFADDKCFAVFALGLRGTEEIWPNMMF